MPIVALGCYAAFVLVALVGRSLLARARTGDWGIRIAMATTPGARVAHALFVGGGLGIALGPALDLVGIGGGWSTRVSSPPDGTFGSPTVGIALAALGTAGTVWSQLVMGASWRIGVDPDERTALVARGPFRLVRNPIFTSMLLAAAGLVVLAPSVVGVVALAMLLAGLELQVRGVEEPYLVAAHGSAYLGYAARTGRFLPGVGLLKAR